MMNNFKSGYTTLLGAMLYVLAAGHPVFADDTEVLVGPGGVAWATPNILFIMDTSGSMARDVDGNNPPAAGEDSRLTIVQNVFSGLINDSSYLGLNMGLMRFNAAGLGGYFVTPMQILSTDSRTNFTDAAADFTAGGDTPLAETLYEAARFYRGMSADFGADTTPADIVSDVMSGGNYISPITSQCQKNYVILLTDGEPNNDTDADESIAAMTGSACTGNCLDELAGFLHTTDQSSSNNGVQTVETYTIGFTTSPALLAETASSGGGDFVVANSEDELAAAFAAILDPIAGSNDTFSPPAMAANAFNSISHYNKLYFTLYEPTTAPKWDGNVKPYEMNEDADYIDADGNVAINDRDGTFLDDSRSFWSTSDDGNSVASGGANGRLPTAASRKLYTFTGAYDADTGELTSEVTLSNPLNALKALPSSGLTFDMLGLTDDTDFSAIINTIRSSKLGDPLHSKPVLINYGGTAADPDLTLYVATNAGFLHALDASTIPADSTSGREQFAFIPKELLTHLPALANDAGAHPYGLDGDVTAWVNDINGDGDISDTIDGVDEHAYIYVGMRRGGKNYYALDVTDRSAPKLKWVIKGGPDGMADFTELGQTWSRPSVTKIKYGPDGGTKTVLIFGGGYDTAQDNNPVNQPDAIGHAIYIVDAETGDRLWWASSTEGADLKLDDMVNSIPSDVRLFDSNLDGNTDRLYVGDMDGRIFRIDLHATDSGMSATGVLFADLGSAGPDDADDNRRFYYPPDVVLTRKPGEPPYISVNIGSGYRSHPLNPVDPDVALVKDRFYSLRDPFVIGDPVDYVTITHTVVPGLFDTTSNLVDSPEDRTALNNSRGWFITLGTGEKVLAPSITVNGEIWFTTYTPSDNSGNTNCAPLPGLGQLYTVSLFDANPVLSGIDVGGDGEIPEPTTEDRAKDLPRRGIPPEPAVMFREKDDGNVDVIRCVGTDCEKIPNAIKMEETYWRDDA